MLKKFFKGLFALIGAGFGYGVYALLKFIVVQTNVVGLEDGLTNSEQIILAAIFAIIFSIVFYRLTPAIGKQSRRAADNIESELQRVPANDILAGSVGLVLGLLVAYLISGIYEGFGVPWLTVSLSIVTYIITGFIGIIIATRKLNDVLSNFTMPKKTTSQSSKNKIRNTDASPKILDTSVIIDGRILDIMKTGFVEGSIVIPEFVLVELRHIADSSDGLKRQRGRRGLDILNKIQSEYGIEIYNTNQEKALDEIPEVDVKLLKLAQIMNGKVVTNDFNLNKVAVIKGVQVLNINELANTLKPVVLPGEEMNLFLVKEGKEQNQGVAYLDDGTMIVVEDGRKYIGQNVRVMVTSVLQTAAGRMIFAKTKK